MKRPERLKMCNEAGLKNYQHLKKSELAKLLEIELPKKLSRKEEKKCRKSHCIASKFLIRNIPALTKLQNLWECIRCKFTRKETEGFWNRNNIFRKKYVIIVSK